MNTSPKLTDQVKRSIATSVGYSSQYQGIETNAKRILTHVLNHWNKNNSGAHPITSALTSAKTVALNICSVELKYYSLSFLIYSISDALYVAMSLSPVCFMIIYVR